MKSVRRISAGAVIVAVAGLAMVAWWSMLAAERAALQASAESARNAAAGVALALHAGADLETTVLLAEQVIDVPFVVRDAGGDTIAGSADGDDLVTVPVPGSELRVSAEVDGSAGLGIGRYGRFVAVGASLVMAVSLWLLWMVARDRQRARLEVARLGSRWQQAAAADDLTGLGNRVRLVEDADALIARGARYGNRFGLAVFEVEGQLSDGLLMAIADVLAGTARGGDLCYRLDGGRFVVLLPEQDDIGATLAADRIRHLLTESFGQPVRSGSAAFAPWLPCTAADLLARAELELGIQTLVTGARRESTAPFGPSLG